MRRVVVPRAGSFDRLRIEEQPDPAPAPGEVHVRVEAAGVNFADCIVRMGLYESARKYVGWPITPGFEVAGTVAAVGAGVVDLEPSARVLAVTRFGGYASDVVVPRSQVFAIPESIGTHEAAAFPAVFLTAYYALVELARPRPGARLLVHSAAGGVGGALLQLARHLGLHAVGVVGASTKVSTARALGAAAVIDKSVEPLWREAERLAPEGYDAIFDANGVETLHESYRHLASPGRLVVYGFHTMLPRGGGRPDYVKLALDWVRTPRFSPLRLTSENRSVMGFNLSYLFERRELLTETMTFLLARLAAGDVVPLPIRTFAMNDVADAHRALESGTTVGKLVLLP